MKQLYTTFISLFALLFLSACGSSSSTPPSTSAELTLSAPTYIFSESNVTVEAFVNIDTAYTIMWTQKEGESISLNGATSLTPNFIAPDINGSSLIELEAVVTKEDNSTLSETLSMELFSAHLVIDAGVEQDVNSNQSVSLHGVANIDDGHTSLEILWKQVDDTNITVILTDSDTFNPTFTSPNVQADIDLVFNLHVNSEFFVADDNVTIRVSPTTLSHVLLPQPIVTHSGSTVCTNSNVLPPMQNHTYTHQWTQVSGPSVTTTTPTATGTCFSAPTTTSTTPIVLQHVVTSTPSNGATATSTTTHHTIHIVASTSSSSTSSISSSSSSSSSVPVATPVLALVTAPKIIDEGTSRTLHVSASGGDNSYTYTWNMTSGNSFVTLDTTDPQNPVLTALSVTQSEIVVLEVVATDSSGSSDTKVISLAVNNVTLAIQASADKVVVSTHSTNLHVKTTSTPILNPITYLWSEVNGSSATISDTTSANPSILFPSGSGTYIFEVTATDTLTNTATDSVKVEVIDTLSLNAGSRIIVNEDTNVSLHATSTGGFGATKIIWTQTVGTLTVNLLNADTLNPTFITPIIAGSYAEGYKFELSITDTKGRVKTDSVEVIIEPVLPTLSISAPTSAPQNSDVSAICNVQGGVAPFVYKWTLAPTGDMALTTPITDANVTVNISSSATTPVTLQCEVSDVYGRSVTATSVLAPYAVIPPLALAVKTSSSPVITENEIATLSSHVTGGIAPYIYSWTKSSTYAGTISTANQASASYFPPKVGLSGYALEINLLVTDATGATVSAREIITVQNDPLTVSIGGANSVLKGQSLTLSAHASGASGNYSYSWVGGLVTTKELTLDTKSLPIGVYPVHLDVTDTVNNVDETVSKVFNVTIKPNPITVQFTNPLHSSHNIGNQHNVGRGPISISNALANEIFTWSVVETSGNTPALTNLHMLVNANTLDADVEFISTYVSVPTTYTFDITISSTINAKAARSTTVATSIIINP